MGTPQLTNFMSPQLIVPGKGWMPPDLDDRLRQNRSNLGQAVRDVLKYVPRDMPDAAEAVRHLLERLGAALVIESNLNIRVTRGEESLMNFWDRRPIEDYGWVGFKVVTTAGVNFLVDGWKNDVELEILRFHGIGTGTAAEAITDTTLATELTTEYTGNVRATGSLTEGAGANIFRSVATITLDGTPGAAIREHGIFSQAATGGGTLFDRTLITSPGVSMSSGDSLTGTWDLTANAGG